MFRKSREVGVVVLAVSCIGMASCGKKKDSDSNDGSENALAVAYPSTLAISAFPSDKTTSLGLEDSTNDVNNKPPKEKIENAEQRMKGVGDCIDPAVFKTSRNDNPMQSNETCYEFDWDMNPYTRNGKSGGTKTGLNSDKEACMVAFAREQVNKTVDKVDRALALVGGIMCQAKKDGAAALPAVGETLTLTDSLKAALPAGLGAKALKSKSATITRLADSSSGAAVYKSTVVVEDPRGKEMTINLTHTPGVDGAESGVLNYLLAEEDAGAGDDNNTASKNNVMSINYSRETVDGKKRMRFEVRRASLVSSITPFNSDGVVDYSAIPSDASNSTAHKIAFTAFDMDPDTNAGTLSYWMNPGGGNLESARGFLFSIEAASDGTLSGCGVSGAADNISIRKAVTDGTVVEKLKPAMWWHPFENQNTNADKDSAYNANSGSSITKQCFKQSASGVYEIDTTKTTGSRGYDLIAGTASPISPPPRPARKVEIK